MIDWSSGGKYCLPAFSIGKQCDGHVSLVVSIDCVCIKSLWFVYCTEAVKLEGEGILQWKGGEGGWVKESMYF